MINAKVIIEVRGGVVQQISTTDPNIKFAVIDYDNQDEFVPDFDPNNLESHNFESGELINP